MKIEIRIEPPRLLSARGRRSWVVAAVLLTALAVAVPIAWASDLFGDVPDTNPFHDDIGAIARAGITKGCSTTTPPDYCPSQNVTREAMAAFLHRGFGRTAYTLVNNLTLSPATNVAVMSQDITVGLPPNPLPGAAGFVLATGTVSLTPSTVTCTPTPRCLYVVWLTIDGTRISESSFVTVSNGDDSKSVSASVTAVGTVITPGPHTVAVRIVESGGPTTTRVDGNLTALYVPFGSTGTNTLSH